MAKTMIANIHRVNIDNLGDQASSPLRYFDLGTNNEMDVGDADWPNADAYVVGGGGLFHCDEWIARLERLVASHSNIIFWGVGSNIHGQTEPRFPAWLSDALLVGLRDWPNPYQYVPCPTCMAPVFGHLRDVVPDREYMIYEHWDAKLPISGVMRICNCQPINAFSEIISLMATAQCIISNSYHGLYWAMLLGRKAVCMLPMSSRFYGFKYPPQFATVEDWKEKAEAAQVYPHFLEECRSANLEFYSKVKELIR